MRNMVFLSHSGLDRPLAAKIVDAMKQKGIDCWANFNDMVTSEQWSPALVEAIEKCEIFLLLLTANSNHSKHVLREITQADNNNKPLYCFQIENIELSKGLGFLLTSIHRYEAYNTPFGNALERLADDIGRHLTGPLYTAKKLLLDGDPGAAFHYFKKAGAAEPEASFYMGRYYSYGTEPVFLDYEEAKNYFSKAISKNCPLGYYGLGFIAELNRNTFSEGEVFFKKALGYILDQARSGDFMASFLLGNYYYFGNRGLPRNDEKAFYWYRQSADQGFAEAESFAGNIYCDRQDYNRALQCYLKAAQKNSPWALTNLGNMYEKGMGVEKDEAAAFKFFSKAAGLNESSAINKLGDFYLFGRYVKKDASRALGYYRQAEKLMNSSAILMLGAICLDGEILPKNETLGIQYYKHAYELGSNYAAYHLGSFFEIKKDLAEARKWYQLAARAGVKEAQEKINS